MTPQPEFTPAKSKFGPFEFDLPPETFANSVHASGSKASLSKS